MPRREKVHENEPLGKEGRLPRKHPSGESAGSLRTSRQYERLPAFQGAHPNPSTDDERDRLNKQPTHTEDVIVHRMQYGTRYPRVEMRKDTAPDIVRRNLGQTAATHEMDSGRSGYGTPQQTAERLRPAVGMRRIGSVLRNRVDEPLPADPEFTFLRRRLRSHRRPLHSRRCGGRNLPAA